MSDEEAEQALLFALRPDGLVNSGEEIYRAMDQNFEGKSQMIPVEIKKTVKFPQRVQKWHRRKSLR